MAQDPIQDGFAGNDDPLDDSVEGADDQPELGVQDGEPDEGADDTGDEGNDEGDDGEQGIEGTPYKDQAALANGYKNIQRLVAAKDREIASLARQVEIAVEAIKKFSGGSDGKSAVPKGFQMPQGDDFWKEMAKAPGDFITKIVQAEAQRLINEQVGSKVSTLETTVQQQQRQSLVNDFLRSHPEFTPEDEAEMVKILDANPNLKEMPDGLGLDLAYDRVLANKFRTSQKSQKRASAVAGAKTIAGLGGKKTSLPAQKANDDKDPFDEVLDRDRQERELFKMGRK